MPTRQQWTDALVLTRPKSYLPSFLFCLTGYVAAGGALRVAALVPLFLTYSVCLWGGTSALNSAYDKDTGPINFLQRPPPPPPWLAKFGIALMLAAVPLCLALNVPAILACALCILLSVAYNMPLLPGKRRGKHIPVLDNLINALGCGALALWIGAAFAPQPSDAPLFGLCVGFTLSVFGTFPVTQIYQLDLQRSNHEQDAPSFSTYLGPRLALRIGAVVTGVGACVAAWSSRSVVAALCIAAGLGTASALMWWASQEVVTRAKGIRPRVLQAALLSRLFWIFFTWQAA